MYFFKEAFLYWKWNKLTIGLTPVLTIQLKYRSHVPLFYSKVYLFGLQGLFSEEQEWLLLITQINQFR